MQIARVRIEGTSPSNCYVVACARTGEAVVVDPGAEPDKIAAQCSEFKVRHLVCTHGHRNHASAKDDLKALVGGETALAMEDAKAFLRSADRYPLDGDRLAFGEFELEVLATPGHSPGSLCFKVGNHLFTGDTLLAASLGRTDLPDIDLRRQLMTVITRLLPLPENTVVYPGHGGTTTIGQERRQSPAVQALRP